MKSFKTDDPKPRKNRLKWLVIGLVLIGIVIGGGVIAVRHTYNEKLKPVSSSQEIILVEIESGSTPHEIAELLEEKGVIRAAWAFEWYIRNEGIRDQLKAGTYALRASLTTEEVVKVVTKGEVATDSITIFPGQRIDELREHFINEGFSPSEVDEALDPSSYQGHPALVDKPTGASLEGYIYPETFHRTADTTVKEIVTASLDELHERLTPELRATINKQGLTIHEGIILASVIENEVTTKEDREKAAQVFLRRLNENIALESDVTAKYGAILDGQEPSIFYSSPYNSYEHPGLPPGPISNVSIVSLHAVADPATTDFLFFVAGNDCITRFSKTIEQHEQLQAEHGVGCKP
jgi:UPF0755 protein